MRLLTFWDLVSLAMMDMSSKSKPLSPIFLKHQYLSNQISARNRKTESCKNFCNEGFTQVGFDASDLRRHLLITDMYKCKSCQWAPYKMLVVQKYDTWIKHLAGWQEFAPMQNQPKTAEETIRYYSTYWSMGFPTSRRYTSTRCEGNRGIPQISVLEKY